LKKLKRPPYFRGWFLVVIIGLAVCVLISLYGIPYSADLDHHYRLAQCFYDSIVRGDLYPSWLSFSNGGYGDPSVRFYPPALSYLLSVFRLLTGDWYLASILALTLLTVIGGLGMYLWARSLTGERCAVLASLLYMLAPFHASEMFQAGMFAQYACACVLPFVFAFIERIIARGKWSDVAGLGISYGLLVLCNLPMVVLGSLAAGVYALIRLMQSFGKRSVYQLAVGILSGLALSCFYWLPMLFEMKWKSPSGVGQGAWFDYKNNFIFRPSPNELGDWWITIMIVVTLVMALPALVLFVKRKRKTLAPALIALFSFLMATPLSKPVWDALPQLQETQFPWRWLTITSACLSLLVALSLPELVRMWQTRLRPLSFVLVGITVIGLSFTALQVMRGAMFQDRQTFDRKVAALRDSETNKDFFPIWATGKPQKMDQPVEVAGRDVHVISWSEKQKEFQIDTQDTAEV
jgi:uncharacterized membrane protein